MRCEKVTVAHLRTDGSMVMVPVMGKTVLQFKGNFDNEWEVSVQYGSFDKMLADESANYALEYREVLDDKIVLRHASSGEPRVVTDFRPGIAAMNAAASTPSLDDMARMWFLLGDREKQLLHLVTTRILSGQQQYGKLTPRKKNAAKETLEEACDASIYTAMGMLDLMDEGK